MIAEKILDLCGGNAEAAEFILQLWAFADVWDDAVDKDVVGKSESVNASMMWALFGLHDSPFYRKHEGILRPAIMSAIGAWMTANKFEKSGDLKLVEQAYFLRCAHFDVFTLIILLVAGFKKQLEAIEFFRAGAPEDTMRRYKEEHGYGMHGRQ